MTVQLELSPLRPSPVDALADADVGVRKTAARRLPHLPFDTDRLGCRARILFEDWYRMRSMLPKQVGHAHQP